MMTSHNVYYKVKKIATVTIWQKTSVGGGAGNVTETKKTMEEEEVKYWQNTKRNKDVWIWNVKEWLKENDEWFWLQTHYWLVISRPFVLLHFHNYIMHTSHN